MYWLSFLILAATLLAQEPQVASNENVPVPVTQHREISQQERADILMARKMYREAIEIYKSLPANALTFNKIGIAYHQLTELDTAEKYYLRAAKADPKYYEAINNLGTIYYARKSFRKAINQYKKVLRLRPDSASTLANLGSAYFARKQYELATEAFQRALEIDPLVFEAARGSGSVIRDRTVGDRPRFFYTMAKNYAKKGLNEKALNYMRRAIEEGFKEREKFLEEPEFSGLKADPEFERILKLEPKSL